MWCQKRVLGGLLLAPPVSSGACWARKSPGRPLLCSSVSLQGQHPLPFLSAAAWAACLASAIWSFVLLLALAFSRWPTSRCCS
eukprot:4365512-Amphidinium_carterae.1